MTYIQYPLIRDALAIAAPAALAALTASTSRTVQTPTFRPRAALLDTKPEPVFSPLIEDFLDDCGYSK